MLRPEGQGPFGAVVLNHGVSASARERARESSDLLINAAAVFARRGYVVVMPLRRGFGATGGEMAEDPGSCSNPDYFTAEGKAAEDVMAAYDYARALPYVDGNRMILAGQSAGGMVSLFTAGTRNPQGLIAVLSFAAGRGGDPDATPGVPCAVEPVARVLDVVGKHIRAPVLMHYAENDLFFSPKISRGWYERFAASGAKAEYALQPAFGKDGHYIFGDTARRALLAADRGRLPRRERRHLRPPRRHRSGPRAAARARSRAEHQDRCLQGPLSRVPRVARTARLRGQQRRPLRLRRRAAGRSRRRGQAVLSVSKSGCLLYAVDDAVIWKESVAGQGAVPTAAAAAAAR